MDSLIYQVLWLFELEIWTRNAHFFCAALGKGDGPYTHIFCGPLSRGYRLTMLCSSLSWGYGLINPQSCVVFFVRNMDS